MTLWILWSLLVSALIAGAAAAVERGATNIRVPRRFVWLTGMLAATVVPSILALQRTEISAAPDSAAIVAPVNISLGADASPKVSAPSAASPDRSRTVRALVASPISQNAVIKQSYEAATFSRRAFADIAKRVPVADPWVAGAWSLASLLLLASLLRSLARMRRERARWKESHTTLGPGLVAENAGPAVVGFFRPRVVIPAWALSLAHTSREMLLRHEAEHVRAGDSRALLSSEIVRISVSLECSPLVDVPQAPAGHRD